MKKPVTLLTFSLLLTALPASAAAMSYKDMKKQYPKIDMVDFAYRASCTPKDSKDINFSGRNYAIWETPAPDGGMPLRGISYIPRVTKVDWLLPLASQEIVQGSGCFYLVRNQGEATFTIWTVNEKRQLVRGETTPWDIAQNDGLLGLMAVGEPADAKGGRNMALLDGRTGEVLFRMQNVSSNITNNKNRLSVWRPRERHKMVTNPGFDPTTLFVHLVGDKEPVMLVDGRIPDSPTQGRRINIAAAGSPFWLNHRIFVHVRQTSEGVRYRLQNPGNDKIPDDLLKQEFSRIVYLGSANKEMEVGLDLDSIKALHQSSIGLFAFEVTQADGNRYWKFFYDNNKEGTGILQTLSGKYESMAVMDWNDNGRQEKKVIAREPQGDFVMIGWNAEPGKDARGSSLEAMRASMEAQALAKAEQERQWAKARAESEERIRRAEAYYAGERTQEAAALERQRQAAAARERDSIGASINSITDTVVDSLSKSKPSAAPRGVNQGVYDSRNDSTGAGANSYQKALEREADRRARCTGANC